MNLNYYIQSRDDIASQILLKNEEERAPFILYLRKFDLNIKHGIAEQGERVFLEEQIFNSLPKNVNLITTTWASDDRLRKGHSEKIPSIILGEDWQPFTRAIIGRAELIIVELTMLSEGVEWELNTIIQLKKNHNTVLVLPPIDAFVERLDHKNPLDQFPRVVWADQLHHQLILENFTFKDLLIRISDIASANVEQRMEAYENAVNLNKYFPITYQGVLSGYLKRIAEWDIDILFTERDFSYYKFWDYIRVASVIGIHLRLLNDNNEEYLYQELANAYINIAQYLLLNPNYLYLDDSFITQEFFIKIVHSIKPILSKMENPSWFTVSLAEKTIERFNHIYP